MWSCGWVVRERVGVLNDEMNRSSKSTWSDPNSSDPTSSSGRTAQFTSKDEPSDRCSAHAIFRFRVLTSSHEFRTLVICRSLDVSFRIQPFLSSLSKTIRRSVNSLGNKILPFVIYEDDRAVPKRERLQDQNELSTFDEVVSPHLMPLRIWRGSKA